MVPGKSFVILCHEAPEVDAWEKNRNASVAKVQWRFTTADARTKLAHLYPGIQV
jgi:hypothetical protein